MVLPPGGEELWLARAREALSVAGAVVADAYAPCPGKTVALPLPWRALLALERFFKRPRPDFLAKTAPSPASRPGQARPDVDILVVAPGCEVSPELLAQAPLGALQMEPVSAARIGRGVLEGRLLWHRAGHKTRLAAATATSAQGPLPLRFISAHLAKAALMPARVLARYGLLGEAFWESLPEAEPPRAEVSGPTGWGSLVFSLAGYGLKKLWQDVFCRRQWHLAMRTGNGDPLRANFAAEPFTPLIVPGKTGLADPFLVRRNGRAWLFAEEIPYRKKGMISVMELLPDASLSEPRLVLEEPFHLSYPHVFGFEGQMYMVPESAGARQVRLYRAVEFPWRWELERVLLDNVPATDATFLQDETGWWMFATLRPDGGSSWDELHLFRSGSLFGPYRPHPLNPVVSDVRRARPAGRIIRKDGRILRPAQDSSGWYGRALAMMEITVLTETDYEEREAARLEPERIPGSVCLHSFAADNGIEIVDGQRFVPIWRRV